MSDCFKNIYGVNSFVVSYPFSETHLAWAAMLPEPEHSESWRGMTEEEMRNFKENSDFSKWCHPVPTWLLTSDRIIKVDFSIFRKKKRHRNDLNRWVFMTEKL